MTLTSYPDKGSLIRLTWILGKSIFNSLICDYYISGKFSKLLIYYYFFKILTILSQAF